MKWYEILRRKLSWRGYNNRFINGTKGALSILMSFLMLPFLTLGGLLVNSARMTSTISIFDEVLSNSANSTLANYDSFLRKRFGLLAMTQQLDASKGYDTQALLTETFSKFVKDNAGVLGNSYKDINISSVQGLFPLSDSMVLESQITQFGKYVVPAQFATDTLMSVFNVVGKVNDLVKDKLPGFDHLGTVNTTMDLVVNISTLLDQANRLHQAEVDVVTAISAYKSGYKAFKDAVNDYVASGKKTSSTAQLYEEKTGEKLDEGKDKAALNTWKAYVSTVENLIKKLQTAIKEKDKLDASVASIGKNVVDIAKTEADAYIKQKENEAKAKLKKAQGDLDKARIEAAHLEGYKDPAEVEAAKKDMEKKQKAYEDEIAKNNADPDDASASMTNKLQKEYEDSKEKYEKLKDEVDTTDAAWKTKAREYGVEDARREMEAAYDEMVKATEASVNNTEESNKSGSETVTNTVSNAAQKYEEAEKKYIDALEKYNHSEEARNYSEALDAYEKANLELDEKEKAYADAVAEADPDLAGLIAIQREELDEARATLKEKEAGYKQAQAATAKVLEAERQVALSKAEIEKIKEDQWTLKDTSSYVSTGADILKSAVDAAAPMITNLLSGVDSDNYNTAISALQNLLDRRNPLDIATGKVKIFTHDGKELRPRKSGEGKDIWAYTPTTNNALAIFDIQYVGDFNGMTDAYTLKIENRYVDIEGKESDTGSVHGKYTTLKTGADRANQMWFFEKAEEEGYFYIKNGLDCYLHTVYQTADDAPGTTTKIKTASTLNKSDDSFKFKMMTPENTAPVLPPLREFMVVVQSDVAFPGVPESEWKSQVGKDTWDKVIRLNEGDYYPPITGILDGIESAIATAVASYGVSTGPSLLDSAFSAGLKLITCLIDFIKGLLTITDAILEPKYCAVIDRHGYTIGDDHYGLPGEHASKDHPTAREYAPDRDLASDDLKLTNTSLPYAEPYSAYDKTQEIMRAMEKVTKGIGDIFGNLEYLVGVLMAPWRLVLEVADVITAVWDLLSGCVKLLSAVPAMIRHVTSIPEMVVDMITEKLMLAEYASYITSNRTTIDKKCQLTASNFNERKQYNTSRIYSMPIIGSFAALATMLAGTFPGGNRETCFYACETEYVIFGSDNEMINQAMSFAYMFGMRMLVNNDAVWSCTEIVTLATTISSAIGGSIGGPLCTTGPEGVAAGVAVMGAAVGTILPTIMDIFVVVEAFFDTIALCKGKTVELLKKTCWFSAKGISKFIELISDNNTVRKNLTQIWDKDVYKTADRTVAGDPELQKIYKDTLTKYPDDMGTKVLSETQVNYSQYLNLLLLLVPSGTIRDRLMNIIEMEAQVNYKTASGDDNRAYNLRKSYTMLRVEGDYVGIHFMPVNDGRTVKKPVETPTTYYVPYKVPGADGTFEEILVPITVGGEDDGSSGSDVTPFYNSGKRILYRGY